MIQRIFDSAFADVISRAYVDLDLIFFWNRNIVVVGNLRFDLNIRLRGAVPNSFVKIKLVSVSVSVY